MVLMKLRHADPYQHLAYQFVVDITHVSKNFNHWMNVMHAELQPWPQRDMLRKTLPGCFKPHYSRATCIIDCLEILFNAQHHLPPDLKLFLIIRTAIL